MSDFAIFLCASIVAGVVLGVCIFQRGYYWDAVAVLGLWLAFCGFALWVTP